MPGTLYLLPTNVTESTLLGWISEDYALLLSKITVFAVENVRTARRFLRQTNQTIEIENLRFIEIGKQSDIDFVTEILRELTNGNDVGIMSEAGVPGVADPGAEVVMRAHKNNLRVMPLVGPSSIILVLMGSGLNGQSFTFHGYLPIKPRERQQRIRQIESDSSRNNQTQVFIETPYRNQALFSDLIQCCRSSTLLTLGIDLTGTNQFLSTKTIEQWKSETLEFPKLPAIFAIQAQSKL